MSDTPSRKRPLESEGAEAGGGVKKTKEEVITAGDSSSSSTSEGTGSSESKEAVGTGEGGSSTSSSSSSTSSSTSGTSSTTVIVEAGSAADTGITAPVPVGPAYAPAYIGVGSSSLPLPLLPIGLGAGVAGPAMGVGVGVGGVPAAGAATPGMGQLELRILVGSKSAGAVIGKGGSVIKAFRDATGAVIRCDPGLPHATKRIISIKGPTLAVYQALILTTDKLADRKREPPATPAGHPATTDVKDENVVTLLVNNDYIGSIMGRSGTRIVATRDATGAKIKISDKPLEESTEKTITIQGTSDQVHRALALLCEHIQQAQDASPGTTTRIPYQPKAGFPPEYAALMAAGGGYPPYGYPGAGTPAALQMHLHYAHMGMAVPREPQQTLNLPVPNEMAGQIIGRGGQTIKMIREQSGCTIKVADPTPTSTERMITITGTPAANERAVALVYQVMNSASTAPGRGGGGGGGSSSSSAGGGPGSAYGMPSGSYPGY